MARALMRVALAVPLLAIGLGAASAAGRTGPATPLCARAADTNRVGIVAELGNGSVVRQCVGFTTTTITALSVLQHSGIEYATQSYGALGEAVCQIDDQPTQYTSCLPTSGSYWVLFIARSGGAWTSSAQGLSSTTLSNGDDLGFRYDPLTGADPPPVSPAGTCPPPATPTPTPTAPATPTPVVSLPPSTTSHPAATTPTGEGVADASTQGSTPTSSNTATPAASLLGPPSPHPSPRAALGLASKAVIGGLFNPALVIAVCAIAALIGLLGIQGLRRRRQ
jgi:hypothetical protein